MMLETKFNLGDVVYLIRNERKPKWEVCPACDGAGQITLKNDEISYCPKCHGHKQRLHEYDFEGYGLSGKQIYEPTMWMICSDLPRLTVGQIKVTIDSRDGSSEEVYMCNETGVGTGSVWHAEQLFATKEEAEAECLKKNKAEGLPQ